MSYHTTINGTRWSFPDLKTLLAKASPARSGDALAGVAAQSAIERVAAQMALADCRSGLPRRSLVPYEEDEVTRLILDGHDLAAFAPVSASHRRRIPRMVAAHKDHDEPADRAAPWPDAGNGGGGLAKSCARRTSIAVAAKMQRVTAFRNTIGLARPALHAPAAQPSDRRSARHRRRLIDGLLFGVGDAVIGVNPATDSCPSYVALSSHARR